VVQSSRELQEIEQASGKAALIGNISDIAFTRERQIMSALKVFLRGGTVGLAAFAAIGLGFTAQAETSLKGKTVEWTIPFSEKGGSAKWANFFAPLLSEALPGNPTVVVKFMPGAGSTKGANWFQKQKNGDGTVVFGSSGSTQFPYLLGDPRVRYEYKDWEPVMATGTGGVAYLPPDLGKKFDGSANNLKNVNFIYGSQGATRLDLVPLLAWKMLGLKVEPVFGVKGRGDGRLMFERGEANIDYQTSSGYLKGVVSLVKEGKAVPMMTWGALDSNGNIVRDPTFPDVATFKEVCEKTDGCQASGATWDAWKAFFTAGFPVQKIAFLPKGTSKEVIDTFVAAFGKVKARPDFGKISAKRLGKYPMFVGADAKAALGRAITVPDSAKTFVIKWLKEDYGVELK
jgi:tripartite-type tricarboxylate transporter receptor subunit TctC